MTLLTRRPLRHGNMTGDVAAAGSVGWKWRHQRGAWAGSGGTKEESPPTPRPG
ncbi:hypothetical protein E2C01_072026 [Portunus trituberculatus]|uniref:Uncharacterized protein n=1 Tax=Portunus trituberculatus TaxID=210409 RepID=A0A5B7I6P1_PORTR|nr:hypothetical protein [Portunus trituberculatus]